MYEPELGAFSSRSVQERPKKDRLSVIRPEWKPHDTFDGILKRRTFVPWMWRANEPDDAVLFKQFWHS